METAFSPSFFSCTIQKLRTVMLDIYSFVIMVKIDQEVIRLSLALTENDEYIL